MEPLEIELEVGETLILGDHKLTLIDIDGEIAAVKIDSPDDFYFDPDAIGGYERDGFYFSGN